MRHPWRLILVLLALITSSGRAQADLAYSTANNGKTLIRFDTASPGSVTTIGNFSGAAGSLSGIDFRPADGLLYGYQQGTNQLVTVNLTTAALTLVTNPSTASNISDLGLDFNPAADRLRLVNINNQDLRINVAGGATTVDGTLAYANGDSGFGITPFVNEVAYTNNFAGTASTTIYYLDFARNVLATSSNPNGGVLTTVGSLGVDFNNYTGFDIVTPAIGTNLAYAMLQTNFQSGLYSINLQTGAASLIGNVPGPSIFGLAIVPVAVPEPSPLLLGCVAGAVGLGIIRIRRKRCSV